MSRYQLLCRSHRQLCINSLRECGTAVASQEQYGTGWIIEFAAAARAQELAREILPLDMGIIFLARQAAL